MNREIKFRLWHVEIKKMFSYDLMWGRSGQSGSGWIDAVPFGEAKESRLFHQGNQVGIDPHECEIMQYTGVADKNVKEVYEGDVVKFWGGIGKVIFFTPYAQFMIQHGANSLFNLYELDEVIGNIYESPELLNNEQNVQECDATKS